MHAQVQDLHRRMGVVSEREVHNVMRLNHVVREAKVL